MTVAGSDSGGGAGIQADLKTLEALGTFGTSAITSVTAQNTQGVDSIHPVPLEEVRAQIESIRSDFAVEGAKTGMLGREPVIREMTTHATEMDAPLVVDPVMVAATGDRLLDPGAETAYEALIGEATLVTPNVDEAEILTGVDVEDVDDLHAAGERLREMGAPAALVKGGHLNTDDGAVRDAFVGPTETTTFTHPRVDSTATHGSGCTLSSAITARLAQGDDLLDAVTAGIEFMTRAVRYPLDVGAGPGSVHHLVSIRDRAAAPSTQEAVEDVVATLVREDARPLVPEVGMNVVGATPYAESVEDTVGVEGRISRTETGIRTTRGTRFGASSHVARFLLSAREHDPALRFAANVRCDAAVASALETLDGPVVEIDRTQEPRADEEGSTMGWAAGRAFEAAADTPVAIVDEGAVGKEPMTRVLATDAQTLTERLLGVLDALEDRSEDNAV